MVLKLKTMRILCIAAPSKDGVSKIYKIDKDLEELKTLSSKHPLSWIVKGIEQKIAPNSEKIKECVFHSNYDSRVLKNDVESCYKYATQYPNTKYAIYDENQICYDLCEYHSEIINKKRMKINEHYYKIFKDLEGYYLKKINNFLYFDKILTERNMLISEMSKLEKISTTEDFNINKEIESLITESIMGKIEYKLACKNLERIYKNTRSIWKEISLDNYLSQETSIICDKLEKNKKDTISYLNDNNHLRSDISKYKYKIIGDLIANRNIRLKSNYKISYTDILLLRRELQEILHYCKTNSIYRNYIENVEYLINSCNENLKKFNEFKDEIKISNDDVILAVADFEENLKIKKLEEAEKEEKVHKEKISKVTIASNSVIVKADGTVIEDDSTGPKLIVGKVIESKADLDAEKQERLNRNTIWL